MFQRIAGWIDARAKARRENAAAEARASRERYAILHDPKGIRVADVSIEGRIRLSVNWQDITKIVAFKIDRFSVDHVVVLIETSVGTSQLDEDMTGFWEFVEALPGYLPGIPTLYECWQRVVTPSFKTCPTTLYPAEAVQPASNTQTDIAP